MSRLQTLLATALACLLPGFASAGELEQRIRIPDGGSLRIELDRGDVEVVIHEDADVRIEARAEGIGASSVHFDLQRDGGEVVLTGRTDPWLGWIRGGPRVKVRLWVPAAYHVEETDAPPRSPGATDGRTQISF